MISEHFEELASLYALGALSADEQHAFESKLRGDGELRELVLGLQNTAGLMARSVPQAVPPPRLKARLLARVAASREVQPAAPARSLPGLRFHEAASNSGWKALPLPGAFIKLLSLEPERGYAVLLGKLEAGVRYPAHVNAGPEDIYILSGDLVVGSRRLGAGDFHHADQDSRHEVNYSEHGCTLLAVLTTDDPLVAFAMS